MSSMRMRLSTGRVIIHLFSIDNPVLVQGVDEKDNYSPTTNKQYKYDEEPACLNYIINTAGKVPLYYTNHTP